MIHAAAHKGKAAAADKEQKQADGQRRDPILRAHAGGKNHRHGGEDAEHHADDVEPRIGRGKSIQPFAHHAGNAVFGLKRLFFEKFIALHAKSAGKKDRHGDRYKEQQRTDADARRRPLADAE